MSKISVKKFDAIHFVQSVYTNPQTQEEFEDDFVAIAKTDLNAQIGSQTSDFDAVTQNGTLPLQINGGTSYAILDFEVDKKDGAEMNVIFDNYGTTFRKVNF